LVNIAFSFYRMGGCGDPELLFAYEKQGMLCFPDAGGQN
jgi:hypothetical protein